MSGSEQHDRVALVSAEDQDIIGGIINRNVLEIDFGERLTLLEAAQKVLRRVARYTESVAMVQRVWNHPIQKITLQKQITQRQTQQFLPPECDHSTFEQQLEMLREELEDARRVPRTAGTDEDLPQKLDDMTRDARQSGEEVRALRTQLANALSIAAQVAPTPPQQHEDGGQTFPDSPDFPGSDRVQLRGWIAQLRKVIQHTPSNFPHEQSKIRYAFIRLRGMTLGQILPHAREDGEIGLEDLPTFIQLLEAAFEDPDEVATAERTMREIKQKHCEFSHYYAEFQMIAADLDWNPAALRNALRIGLSEELKDCFTYSDMPEELAVFVTVCQKGENQMRQ